jgi:hypothetical protein
LARAAFVIRLALNVASTDEDRLDGIERRLARLEELAFLGS